MHVPARRVGSRAAAHRDGAAVAQVPNLPDSDVPLSLLRRLYLPELPDAYCRWDEDHPVSYPPVRVLPPHQQLRVLVSGGAGFVGSHLVDRLMLLGHYVIVVDNFFTGAPLRSPPSPNPLPRRLRPSCACPRGPPSVSLARSLARPRPGRQSQEAGPTCSTGLDTATLK